MGWRVILTEPALADLENIVTLIAASSPPAALSTAAELVNAISPLDCMPKRGSPMELRPDVRKLIRRHYLIFYRIDEAREAVKIIRVWDSRRNPAGLELLGREAKVSR